MSLIYGVTKYVTRSQETRSGVRNVMMTFREAYEELRKVIPDGDLRINISVETNEPIPYTVFEVRPLVRRLYDGDDHCTRNSGNVGGHLHIALDDFNWEDGHIQFCLDEARKDNCNTCIGLAEKILRMPYDERQRLGDR